MKNYPNYFFQNWAKNVRYKNLNFFQPENLEELKELIKKLETVHLVGSGHSWYDFWKNAKNLIDLSLFHFEPIIDQDTWEVELPAGMKLWQINDFLDAHHLALMNLGSIDQQSIAGAITTGTHGSGKNYGCLATQCTEFTLLDGKGHLHTLSPENPDYYACLISVGLMGIIVKLKIQAVPAFQIQENTFTCAWQEAVENFGDWINHYDHLKIWWLPPSKEVVVYALTRTNEAIQESQWQNFWREKVLSVWFYRLFVILGNWYPRLRPRINQFLTSQMRKPYERTNKSYKIFKVPKPPAHRETEWAFPLENYQKILFHYFQHYSDNRFTFNFIQEIRVSKKDDFWLSPSYQRDSLWIGLYNHEDKQWNHLVKDFQNFALNYEARPHWGKEYDLNINQIASLFPKWRDFFNIRSKYDPQNKFLGHFPKL
jgi:FAD/FMN-containing dehydrogenase